MIVVSDTSPVNYLVLIDKVDLIHRLFDRVLVPQVVVKELMHPRTPKAVREWMQSPPEWVEARNPRALDPTLETSKLGLGEIHAISLAVELHAALLLADDKDARIAARERGLTVTGTLGILKLAAKQKLIDLSSVISDLRKTNLRMPESTIQEMLREDRRQPFGPAFGCGNDDAVGTAERRDKRGAGARSIDQYDPGSVDRFQKRTQRRGA